MAAVVFGAGLEHEAVGVDGCEVHGGEEVGEEEGVDAAEFLSVGPDSGAVGFGGWLDVGVEEDVVGRDIVLGEGGGDFLGGLEEVDGDVFCVWGEASWD